MGFSYEAFEDSAQMHLLLELRSPLEGCQGPSRLTLLLLGTSLEVVQELRVPGALSPRAWGKGSLVALVLAVRLSRTQTCSPHSRETMKLGIKSKPPNEPFVLLSRV